MRTSSKLMESSEILVTGGAGFIGFHFVMRLLKDPDWSDFQVRVIDSLTYAANPDHIRELRSWDRVTLEQVDISDFKLLSGAFGNPKYVVNFAAETHVDNSLKVPLRFVKTNVLGTSNLLELSRDRNVERFLQVSTDEVYGSIAEGIAAETAPLNPSSPYSASKAAADLLVQGFAKSFDLDYVITRCSNNFGPGQHDEKLIPTMLRCLKNSQPVPIYGDGEYRREWIDVRDHVEGILMCLTRGRSGEIYNLGSGIVLSNLELLTLAVESSMEETQVRFVDDRAAHDRRYALDSSKARLELGFEAKRTLDDYFGLEVRRA